MSSHFNDENKPFTIIQSVDQVPMSGSRSGSTPIWASPAYYIKTHTGSNGRFDSLEAATGSAEWSGSETTSSSFQFGGQHQVFSSRRGSFKANAPSIGASGWKFRYAGKGLLQSEVSNSTGAPIRDKEGCLKAKSGHYMVLNKDGEPVWGTVLSLWDGYKSLDQIPTEEQQLGDPRQKPIWSKGTKNTSGSNQFPTEPGPPAE